MRNTTMIHRVRRTAAFTLVELLVVIAITSILLGLLFYPIFQAFRFTNLARNSATAQDVARTSVEKIQRELAQATFVFDNTQAPIVIPLSRTVTYDGASTNRPPILFAKLDLILPDRRTDSATDPVDPTTGKPISGGTIRFPLAPGTRVVRYFLGLSDNNKPYTNFYEFPGQDTGFNPVLLYRAEFDPNDPNLFAQGVPATAPGGFNDPNFYYNTSAATTMNSKGVIGNGASYASNWARIASPVISGPHLDLLAWRKDGAGELMDDLPFRTLSSFGPGAVPGDTGKPGFLTAGNAEAPGAPPTLYTTQYGQWTAPFTLTFYRSTSNPLNEGTIKFTFEMNPAAPNNQKLRITSDGGAGTLTTAAGELYCATLRSSGKIFVKTPRLTFAVDPQRGRLETGFPPLAGTAAGVPLVNNGSSVAPMAAGIYPDVNLGDVIPTVLRVNTRDPRADGTNFKLDQGLMGVDLMEATTLRYYADPGTLPAAVPAPAATGDYYSPLRIFGNTDASGVVGSYGGLLLAPGTERVIGPEIPLSISPQLLPYNRTTDSLNGEISAIQKKPANTTGILFAPVTGQRTYDLDQIRESPKVLLTLDVGDRTPLTGTSAGLYGAIGTDTPGIPANPSGAPAASDRELRMTYLWQNNYGRDAAGHPLNADDSRSDLGDFKPEADVVKADYSTRSLLNIQVGARVYDSSSPVPKTIQFSDRVKVGNATR